MSRLLALVTLAESTPPNPPWTDPEQGLQSRSWGAGWTWNAGVPHPVGVANPVHDRALGWYFEGEEVVITWTGGAALASWELRDYVGNLLDQGDITSNSLNLGQPGVGWYKLYLIRAVDTGPTWGLAGGEVTFIVSRTGAGLRDAPIAVAEEGNGWVSSPNRSYIGTGVVRVDVDINNGNRAAWRASLDAAKDVATTALGHLLPEPGTGNEREVLVQFPDGEATGGPTPTIEQQYQITTTVQEMCAMGVTHFEGRNEPVTGGRSGATTAAEYAAFAALVHAADPAAKVGGPCPVNVNPKDDGLGWLRDFFEADGGDYIDFFTFHPYNATNNDANQGRRVYTGLVDLLVEFGQEAKPRWMTEYGHYAFVYGSFEPRWHAQVMMLEGHLLWQVAGVHRNHVMHYYDFNVGYWDQPMFMWASESGRKCPTPLPLMWRTWVEETWGMEVIEALDFGEVENRHWVGTRFGRDDGTQCLTIQGGRVGTVTLAVSGASVLEVADYFGRIVTAPVTGGQAVIGVGMEPTHIRIPAGVTATVIPVDYGEDVTPRDTLTASGSTGGNGPERAVNGLLDNTYEGTGQTEWRATEGDSGPSWWRMAFDTPVTFDAVEVICPPPWQHSGSLLDFDVQALVGGQWVTLATHTVPTPEKVWSSAQAAGSCWVDSFWSRERIFAFRLPDPVAAHAVRIYARDFSFGGGATINTCLTAGNPDAQGNPRRFGQGGRKRMTLQEVAIYRSGA